MTSEIRNGKDSRGHESGEAIRKPLRKGSPQVSAKASKIDASSTNASPLLGLKDNDFKSDLASSAWTQFVILLKRILIQSSRNMVPFYIQLGHHIFCAILIGVLFQGVIRNSNQIHYAVRFLVSVLIFYVFTQMIVPALVVPLEMKHLKREYFNGWYGLKSYYLATTLHKLLLQLFFGGIFIIITFFMAGFPFDAHRLLRFSFVCYSTSLISEGLGYTIGSIFNIKNGSTVAAVVLAVQAMLAIFGVDFLRQIDPVRAVFLNSSYVRVGLMALLQAAYGFDRGNLDCDQIYCVFKKSSSVLTIMGIGDTAFNDNSVYLLVAILLTRSMTYIALLLRLATDRTAYYFDRFLNILYCM